MRPEREDEAPSYSSFAYERKMPKLNSSNPEVRGYFMKVCAHWIREYGVDGWRLDVANEVDRVFWRTFKQTGRGIDPESVMIGEIWESAESWLRGDMFDSTMNYDFRKNCRDFFGMEKINAVEFNARVTQMNYRYPTGIVQGQLNLLDSHDVSRFFSYCQNDIRRLRLAEVFLFTAPGVPCVFYGDELGMSGDCESTLRGPMPWENPPSDERDFFKALISLRRNSDALLYGTYTVLDMDENGLYVFERRCVFNNADSQRNVYMSIRAESSIQPGTVLENVLDPSDRITVSQSGKIAVELTANSNKIYKVSSNQIHTTAPVTFYVHNATTSLGQNVYIAGNTDALGNWNADNAAGPAVCPTYPTWSTTVNLPVGETIQYKAIKRGAGAAEWEGVSNRSYTVPENGGAVSFTWSAEGETTLVPVQFTVKDAYTTWGENIYIVGNVPELGEWSVDLAVGPALCPSYPTWTVFIDVPAGCAIEWKALKKGASTQTIWQGGENNTFTVPTSGIGSTITSWR